MDKITNKNALICIIPCSIHIGEQITRGCTDILCSQQCLYCPQCERKDKQHTDDHRTKMRPISDVIIGICKELEKFSKEEKSDNSVLMSEMEKNLKSMQKHLREQRNKLESDFKKLIEHVLQVLKETHLKMLDDFDRQYEIFNKNYQIFKASFSKTSTFNPYESVSNSKTFVSKLKSFKSIQEQSDFLAEIKEFLHEKQKVHSTFSPTKQKNEGNIFKIEELLKNQMKDPPTYNTPNLETLGKKVKNFSEKIHKIFENHIFFYPIKSAFIYSAFRNMKFPKGPESLHFNFHHDNKSVSIKQETLDNFILLNPKEPLQTNHDKPLQSILALSNEIIVTGGSDNLLKLWDLNSKKCLKNLYGNTSYITSLSLFHLKIGQKELPQIKDFKKKFSDYGFLLINGSFDKNLVIWDSDFDKSTVNTTKFMMIRGHDYYITCMQQLYNGENLITGDEKGFIIIWNILQHKAVFKSTITKNSHRKAISSIVIIENSHRFITTDLEGVLLVWELIYQRGLKSGLESILDCKIAHFIKSDYGGINCMIPRSVEQNLFVSSHDTGKIIIWKMNDELKKIKSDVLIDDIQDSIHQISLVELEDKKKEFVILCLLSQKHGVCAINNEGKIVAAIKFGSDEDLVSNSLCSSHKFQFVGNHKPILCILNQSREKKNVDILEINI